MYYGVGGTKRGNVGKLQKSTWYSSFKWKPLSQNTVDFLVVTKKQGATKKDYIGNIFSEGLDMDKNGNILQRIGNNGYGFETGQFVAPHGICLDSNKDIYVAEVARTNMSHYTTPPDTVRSFQKLRKV